MSFLFVIEERIEKDGGNHKPRGGLNWFPNQMKLKKLELKKASFLRIISQTFDKPRFNQSPLTQNPLLKLFLKKIFSLTFSKLIKTRMRKKDKIKRRCTPIFILVHSLSLEKLIQLSNPTQIIFSLCI